MNRIRTVAIVSILVAALTSYLVPKRVQRESAVKAGDQPALARVLESRVLRAGYINYPPATIVDSGKSKFSGIAVDILREIASELRVELQLVEEVGWGSAIQGLATGRYETIATTIWANPRRSSQVLFTRPVSYSPVGIWVRANETRFSQDNGWRSINSPKVRIIALDGSTMLGIANSEFPNARITTYPDLTSEFQLFQDLEAKKADVFLAEPAAGALYLKNNPGAARNIAIGRPLRAFPNTFVVHSMEPILRNMLDTSLGQLHNSGFVERVLRKYEPAPNTFYRVKLPYKKVEDEINQ